MRTRPTLLRLLALPLALLLGLSACGSDGEDVSAGGDTTAPAPDGSTTAPPVSVAPGEPDEVVIRVETAGGFVPVDVALATLPELSIMGDGTALVTGPQTMQYPGSALPNLLQGSVAPEVVADLITAAREAGLLDGEIDFGTPGITDMASTSVTLSVDGEVTVQSAYALSFEDPAAVDQLTPEQSEARTKLADFITAAQEAVRDASRVYTPERVSVFRLPVFDGVEGGIDPGVATWPLDDPFAWPASSATEGCQTYEGEDAATVIAAAVDTNTATNWSIDAGPGADPVPFRLVFRPLLPDETQRCNV